MITVRSHFSVSAPFMDDIVVSNEVATKLLKSLNPSKALGEDADLDSMVTHCNKAVTDTAAELLGKQRRKRKPWVTPEFLDLCDQRRDLKKKGGEPEAVAKDYRLDLDSRNRQKDPSP